MLENTNQASNISPANNCNFDALCEQLENTKCILEECQATADQVFGYLYGHVPQEVANTKGENDPSGMMERSIEYAARNRSAAIDLRATLQRLASQLNL